MRSFKNVRHQQPFEAAVYDSTDTSLKFSALDHLYRGVHCLTAYGLSFLK